ncbi:transposase [Sphingobium sp. YR768]|uniref:transposase n=1 Tax=Sphingobium sp. YR768 TaxID=1884365 RepID=UPI000A7ABB1A
MVVHPAVSAVGAEAGDPKPSNDLRDVLDALRYLTRTGVEWRMLPNDFPPWQTVYW